MVVYVVGRSNGEDDAHSLAPPFTRPFSPPFTHHRARGCWRIVELERVAINQAKGRHRVHLHLSVVPVAHSLTLLKPPWQQSVRPRGRVARREAIRRQLEQERNHLQLGLSCPPLLFEACPRSKKGWVEGGGGACLSRIRRAWRCGRGAWAGVSDFGAGPLLVQYIPGDTIANIISALSSFSKYCHAWCGTW